MLHLPCLWKEEENCYAENCEQDQDKNQSELGKIMNFLFFCCSFQGSNISGGFDMYLQ